VEKLRSPDTQHSGKGYYVESSLLLTTVLALCLVTALLPQGSPDHPWGGPVQE